MTNLSCPPPVRSKPLPSSAKSPAGTAVDPRQQLQGAVDSWLTRSPSADTRSNYLRDLKQFLSFAGIPQDEPEQLVRVLPRQISAWRDHLADQGLTNSSVRRKLTVLRSLFSYLQIYGYSGVNPAHGKFVAAPAVPRDGKTVALSPEDCRRLLESPLAKVTDPESKEEITLPGGVRNRALLAVLAFTGIRVGELCRLCVGDMKTHSGLRILEVRGKGGKGTAHGVTPGGGNPAGAVVGCRGHSRRHGRSLVPSGCCGARQHQTILPASPDHSPGRTAPGRPLRESPRPRPVCDRASFRVTALTVARERGADIVALQDFAGHADPRTTLTYIRNRDRLSDSPAYLLKY